MSKTVADASRDYRQRQRAKLERYEAALKEIAASNPYRAIEGYMPADIAKRALHIEVL